jgi:hypothetical protein
MGSAWEAALAMRSSLYSLGMAGLAWATAGSFLPAQAQQKLVPDDPAPQAAPNLIIQGQRGFAEDFDQLVFASEASNSAADAEGRMTQMLARRVAWLDRHYRLSQVQKQKLKLAGRGDIRRLEERVARERQKFIEARRGGTDEQQRAAFADAAALREAVKSGPFGEGSLFAKAQNALLSPEQLQKYEHRRQLAAQSTAKITIENAPFLETAAHFQRDVYRFGWTGGDDEVALLAFGKPLELCSASTWERVRTIGDGRKLVGFDFSRDHTIVAVTEQSTRALLIDLATGSERPILTKNQQPAVSLSSDSKLLATGGYGRRASLWSVNSGKWIRDLDVGPAEGGLVPVFSPDGTILAVGNRNSSTCLFDVASGRLLRKLPWQSSHELKFDPGGKHLAVAYADGNLAIWSVESGDLLQRARPRGQELYSLDWSRDGTLLASCGREAPVTVWRASDLRPLNEIDCPEWVICVRFNLSGTRLMFAGGSARPNGERAVEILGVPQE